MSRLINKIFSYGEKCYENNEKEQEGKILLVGKVFGCWLPNKTSEP